MDKILDMSTKSDYELVILAQSGNNSASDELISRYKNLALAISSRFFMNGYESDDIYQEGMIGLYQAILDYNENKSNFKTFATLCISRKIISALKSNKRQKHIALNSSLSLDRKIGENSDDFLIDTLKDSTSNNPESILISKENYENYQRSMEECLSRLELSVLNLQIEGLSYKEISKKLGKDVKSVDNAVQRIKKKLLKLIIDD